MTVTYFADQHQATVATSYYLGALKFARQLASDKSLPLDWLQPFEPRSDALRIPATQYEALLERAAIALNEPAFGLKYGHQIDISSFNLLGYLAMSSATLAEASQIVNQYGVLVSELGQLEIEHQQDGDRNKPMVKIIWRERNKNHRGSSQMIDGVLAGWINFGKKFLGQPAAIYAVHLTDRDNSADIYAQTFDCPVVLGARENFILLEQQLFEMPLQQAEPAVHAAIQVKAEQAIKAISESTLPLSHQINHQLPKLIFNGEASIESLANQLNMTSRSLQRKLKVEGVNFRQLLDKARFDLTRQLLLEKEQPLSHISGIVGFNDQSSFNRAFKRWTGQTPNEYLTGLDHSSNS